MVEAGLGMLDVWRTRRERVGASVRVGVPGSGGEFSSEGKADYLATACHGRAGGYICDGE